MKKDGQLDPRQLKVALALLSGSNTSEAAEAGGVDRSTVYRWLKTDFRFVAFVNAGRTATLSQAAAQLDALTDEALGVVRLAVRQGDIQVSLAVLKGRGLLSGAQAQLPTDARLMTAEDRIERERVRYLEISGTDGIPLGDDEP